MNPFDELSVEEAVQMREKSRGPPVKDILAVTAGPAKAADTLRTALAMGADRALHIEIPESRPDGGAADPEPLAIAKLLAEVARREESNLVILGKQSIDDDAHQTGQMVAALLGWSQATQASEIRFGGADKQEVTVTREVDGGAQMVRAWLPMVVTTDLRLNTPRYASLPNIMKAKKKPLVKKTLEDFGIVDERRLKVVEVVGELLGAVYSDMCVCVCVCECVCVYVDVTVLTICVCIEPPQRNGGQKVEDVDGMIARLKELGAL